MSFWTREIAGWLLMALGLTTFGAAYFVFLRNRMIFEAGPTAFMGYVIFRGGLHLIKVAVAARICQQAAAAGQPEPARTRTTP